MAEDRGKTRFDELFSNLSRRHDGENARQLFSKLHSVDNIYNAPSDFNYKEFTPARNYATIVSKQEVNSDNSEEDDDDDPIVFREKLQKSKTIRIPKANEFNTGIKRKSVFETINEVSKEANEQLNNVLNDISSSSEDEDDERDKGIRSNTELDAIMKLQQKEKRMTEFINKMKLIDIVQQNERNENSTSVLVDNNLEIFGDESELKIPAEEKKILEYMPHDTISRRIYDSSNELSDGNPVCTMQFQDVLCIGFTKGVIRMFDIQSYQELKVFMPKKRKNFGNKVTCFDISLSGTRLVAGYASGKF